MHIGILVTQSCHSWQHNGIILIFVSKNPLRTFDYLSSTISQLYCITFLAYASNCKLSVSDNNTPKFYESLFLQKHLM